MKFNDLPYSRPDVDAMIVRLNDYAVQFENDSAGTAVNYAALNEAVCTVRSCPASKEALDGSWKKDIEKDFRKRQRRK